MIWGGLIVAAGRGARFGRPKQFVEIAGLPLVGWSVRTFSRMAEISEIVIVTEPDWFGAMHQLLADLAPDRSVLVVAGGENRQQSVRNGLQSLPDRCTAVCVHDGARPLVRSEEIRSGMREVRPGRGAVLANPVVDTVKVVDPASMTIVRTLDRDTLWAAQTPQFAMRRDFQRAHADAHKHGVTATDDVALLERIGLDVAVVAASSENFKVTLPDDVRRAERLLAERLEHAPQEEEVLLLEVFAHDALVGAICREVEERGGSVDAVDRDLPTGIAVRAYVSAERLHGFAQRFEAFADGTATFTTRFSHYAGSGERAAGHPT